MSQEAAAGKSPEECPKLKDIIIEYVHAIDDIRAIISSIAPIPAETKAGQPELSERQQQRVFQSMLVLTVGYSEWMLSEGLWVYFAQAHDDPGFMEGTLADKNSEDLMICRSTGAKVSSFISKGFGVWLGELAKRDMYMGLAGSYKQLIENGYRLRNHIVHDGSHISPREASPDSEIALYLNSDRAIELDHGLLDDMIDSFETGFLLLIAEIWKKLNPKDKTRIKVLYRSVNRHGEMEKWVLVRSICQYLLNDEANGGNSFKDTLLDSALALAQLGETNQAKNIIGDFDDKLLSDEGRMKLDMITDIIEGRASKPKAESQVVDISTNAAIQAAIEITRQEAERMLAEYLEGEGHDSSSKPPEEPEAKENERNGIFRTLRMWFPKWWK